MGSQNLTKREGGTSVNAIAQDCLPVQRYSIEQRVIFTRDIRGLCIVHLFEVITNIFDCKTCKNIDSVWINEVHADRDLDVIIEEISKVKNQQRDEASKVLIVLNHFNN